MPEPKTLGRVDWMSRLKVWRVIRYKGAADIPAGDYPTKEEAEDALRKLVARGNPTPVTPEVTVGNDLIRAFQKHKLEHFNQAPLDKVFTEIGGSPKVLAERLFALRQKGLLEVIPDRSYMKLSKTGQEISDAYWVVLGGREPGALPKNWANLAIRKPEVAIPKAEVAVKGTKAPVEKGSLEQKANALLPMPPIDGPPLPRGLQLKWPWKK